MTKQPSDLYSDIARYVSEQVYDATDSEILTFLAYFGADAVSRWVGSVVRDMFYQWLNSLNDANPQPRATIQHPYAFAPVYYQLPQGLNQAGF